MATSGKVNTKAYDSRYLELAWERTSYSIANNTSTIKWTLTARGSGVYSEYKAAPFKVVIDGVQAYYSETRIWTYPDTQIATGTQTIKHGADGSKSFTIKVDAAIYYKAYNVSGSGSFTLDSIPRYATLSGATDFTDEENPTITYSNPAGNAVTSLTAYIKDSSGTNILSRTLDKTKTSYTFTLTEAERNALRAKVTKGYTATVKFVITTVIGSASGNSTTLSKTLTLVNAAPTFTYTVVDNNPNTTALTGNSSKFVKGYSTAYYTMTAEGKKGATITSYAVSCGGATNTTANGSFLNITNPTIYFAITDSRGNTTTKTHTISNFIEYVDVSCSQKVKMELVGETGAKATVTISGNYFNSTFGAVNNELILLVRYKSNSGSYGSWIPVTWDYTPTFSNGTYTLNVPITGLDYSAQYTFQCNASDKLTGVTTGEYAAKLTPVFDWSGTDFNFNVPVNLQNKAKLRAGTDGNSLVLSATGGKVYFRPNGDNNSNGEMYLTNTGDLMVRGSLYSGAKIEPMTDFVIESGTKDGWEYRKWTSGRAECWKRLAVTTAINYIWQGNIYVSAAVARQSYPVVFTSTPIENVTIQASANAVFLICDSGGLGANGTHQSAQYKLARATSATTAESTYYLSYYVCGKWR